MTTKRVVIVGAGPAGATLALLLARRGIGVTLLERHHDFDRAFRGEGLQLSGVDAFRQMGLADRLERLPHARIELLEIYRAGRLQAHVPAQTLGIIGMLVSQPALLEMLTGEAARFPSFELVLGASVRDVLRDGSGRVCGVRADTAAGPRDFPADLVVGTDGRHSTLRKHGPFTELKNPQCFDILWVKLPMPEFFHGKGTFRMEIGDNYLTGFIPAADGRLQVAFFLPKGAYRGLRSAGVEVFTKELLSRVSPEIAAHLQAHPEDMAKAVLLDVVVGRLTEWTAPGMLLLGDAAHPMSPIGGQGINLALRDALVAANHLVPVLSAGGGPEAIDTAAKRIETERMPEIVAMQEHQSRQARMFLEPNRWESRLAMWMMPFLVRTGLVRVLMGRRLHHFAHGTVPVRLTV